MVPAATPPDDQLAGDFLAAAFLAGPRLAAPERAEADFVAVPALAVVVRAPAFRAGALRAAFDAAAAFLRASSSTAHFFVVWSSSAAAPERFCTALIPFMQAAFELYASLVATTWPFVDTKVKRNFPVVPFLTTNFPGICSSWSGAAGDGARADDATEGGRRKR